MRKDLKSMAMAMGKVKNPINIIEKEPPALERKDGRLRQFIKKKRTEKLADEIDRTFNYMEKNPQITHFGWVRGKADKLKKKNKIL